MCRSVKIQITYLKMRLSLRLVRSLRTIRGRSRRFPHRSCSSLRTKWKAGEFAPFSQLLVSFAAVLVVLPFSFFFLVFSAPFPLMGPKRPKEKTKKEERRLHNCSQRTNFTKCSLVTVPYDRILFKFSTTKNGLVIILEVCMMGDLSGFMEI